MRVMVFGSGAVGAYFGGRLAQSGTEVVFIARGTHLQALQTRGLRVDSINGDFHLERVEATNSVAEAGEVDMVLVCTKSWQVSEAAIALKGRLAPESGVLYLGNGVEGAEQVASILGPEHVLGGMCRISAFIAGPGHIQHVAIEPSIAFGERDNRHSPRCEQLLDAFQHASVKAEIPADIEAAIWQKFLFIAAVSGVGAVTRSPVGVFRTIPETRSMLAEALKETAAVANARGVKLAPDAAERILNMIDNMPTHTVASMQRDILDGRPSELESQNGAVVRLGKALGVPTPTHALIYASLLPQEQRARGENSF